LWGVDGLLAGRFGRLGDEPGREVDCGTWSTGRGPGSEDRRAEGTGLLPVEKLTSVIASSLASRTLDIRVQPPATTTRRRRPTSASIVSASVAAVALTCRSAAAQTASGVTVSPVARTTTSSSCMVEPDTATPSSPALGVQAASRASRPAASALPMTARMRRSTSPPRVGPLTTHRSGRQCSPIVSPRPTSRARCGAVTGCPTTRTNASAVP
jgi:hypothetical protein